MRSLLQFLGVSGAWIAVCLGTLSIALWAGSLDENPRDKRVTSSLLWSMFWPLAWLHLRLTGKNTSPASRRGARSSAVMAISQIGTRERSAQRFRTVREAKEYLVGVIAKEAERSGTPLTEVERKMLFFTETGWTLPDMREISSEFDRGYDQNKYEEKIASIITRIDELLTGEYDEERAMWDWALEKLSEGDHYLLVLVDGVNQNRKGARHNFKMLFVALVFFALAALNLWFRNWLRDH